MGERWTLLIARELFAGPQRFSDLLQTLPGIGNGLLATRLHEMHAAGLIEIAELPPPAASRVYQLTRRGRQLDEVVTALGRWGSELLAPPGAEPEEHRHPLWLLQSLAARTRYSSEPSPERSRVDVDVLLDGQLHHVRIRSGRAIAGRGPHPQARAQIITSSEILYALSKRQMLIEDAIKEGRVEIKGDQDAARRVLRILAVPDTPEVS